MNGRSIDIAAIDIGDRLRALDPAWSDLLAEEMERDGQTVPIRVVARGDRFQLIDGARRVEALRKLGRDTVAAVIEPEEALADDAAVRLGEIKGNLMRGELTVLDRALYVAAWSAVYLSVHTVRKPGRPTKETQAVRIAAQRAGISRPGVVPANDDDVDPFVESLTEAVRGVLGISDRSLRRLRHIASIGVVRARLLVGHASADNRTELLLLADQPEGRQDEILRMLTCEKPEAETVADAVAILEGEPARLPLSPSDRLHQSFARLDPKQREAFVALNRDEIERLLAAIPARASRKPALRSAR